MAAMLAEFAGPVLLSLLLGSLYTMMALGLTMTYAVTKIPNFAHAELVTVGAYVSVVVINLMGMGTIEAFAASFVVTALVALGVDEVVYKPLFRRHSTPLHLLVASIGVGLVIRYVLSIFADIYDLLLSKLNVGVQPLFFIGYGAFTSLHAWVLPTVLGFVILLHILFHRTLLGKSMRATASNFDLARASGINTVLVRRVTWLIAGGLAGLSGYFWAIFSPINPETGWLALLRIFAASILGGLVSFYGTIVGGYIVGFSENIGIFFMSQYFGVETAYRPLIAFAIIVVVFLFKPTGFAGMSINLSKLLRRILHFPILGRIRG